VAGLAELLGGLTGYILVESNGGEDISQRWYGVIYGFVCGVVATISVRAPTSASPLY